MPAHRFAYRLAHGPLAPDECVRHLVCDNPPCCNERHLARGDTAANIADRDGKERQSRGERQPHAKLTQSAADDIRRRYASGGVSQQTLANEYGVSQVLISKVVRGQNWR